ncbi:MAG: CHASE2 domain-containing protein [Bacteroidota bacterium]
MKKGQLHRRLMMGLAYALGMAILLSAISHGIAWRPTVLQMEHAVYDGVQRCFALDEYQTERRYETLPRLLDEILLVNTDPSMIDPETDRLRRDCLAHLMGAMHRQLSPKAVFLDFEFSPIKHSPSLDKMLADSLQLWKGRLVLPYGLPPDEFEYGQIGGKLPMPTLVDTVNQRGYLDHRFLVDRDVIHRYVQVGRADDSLLSAAWALLKVRQQNEQDFRWPEGIPSFFEIKFLLRNQPKGRMAALPFVNARDLLAGTEQDLSDKKVVFVGLFENYQNKYQLFVDQFQTPVSNQMNGAYLIVNTYLNMVMDAYLRPLSWHMVLVLNLCLVLLRMFYSECQCRDWRLPKYLAIFLGMLVLLGGLVALFSFCHLKFPFVLTSAYWVSHSSLYEWFRNRYFQKTNV